MRVLAIDSSGLTATVAVVEDEQTIAEYTVNYKKTHSQTLLPMIDEVKKMIDLDLSSIDAIAVSGGPGSFTGLRIGSATAKGLGLALGKPLIHVPTVDALAYNVYGCGDLICPIMDARRKQVYTGLYSFSHEVKDGTHLTEAAFHVEEQQMAIAVEELIGKLNAYKRPVVFLGDGSPVSVLFFPSVYLLWKNIFAAAPSVMRHIHQSAPRFFLQSLHRSVSKS